MSAPARGNKAKRSGQKEKTALQEAIKWYSYAAKKGGPDVQNTLADTYRKYRAILGISEKNINKMAFDLYKAAAEKDHAKAVLSLGLEYQKQGEFTEAGKYISKALTLNLSLIHI